MTVESNQIEATLYKDPAEKLDYQLDWDAEYMRGADTISASTWTSTPTGLTHVATSVTASIKANIRISGGLVGTTYTVTNHVVLASGQEAERSFYLKVVDR